MKNRELDVWKFRRNMDFEQRGASYNLLLIVMLEYFFVAISR